MTKRRQRILAGMVGLVCGCITACNISCTNLFTGGNSSETTNVAMVTGVVVDAQGSPANNVQVTIRSSGFDPVTDGPTPDSDMVTTGADGIYIFSVAKNNMYTIEAVHRSRRTRALIADIAVGEAENRAPRCTLNAPGAIKVMVSENVDTARGFVFIPGTSIFRPLTFNRGFVLLDSVPVGRIPQIAYSSTNAAAATTLRYNVTVTAGDTAVVGNPGWIYSRTITLNTTATGANVAGTVTGFPVLIRLTAANFDFTQAKNNGEDIRFAKRDNTFLQYEIERWEPVAGLAEVWVKVDTVFGNDSSQVIEMYWGNPDATGESNGAAVFDTANGFAAVWHLDSDFGDATAGNHGGTNFGATDTMGIISGAKKFNGSSYIQIPGLLGAPQSITISAWVHLDSAIGYGQEIVSLGDAVAIRADQKSPPDGTAGFFCSKVGPSDTVHVFTNTGAFMVKTGWRYLVYTVDADRHIQSMYIDGTFQCSTNDINPINYSGLGLNTVLGAHGNKKTQSFAFGCIDEARVCRLTRSADWIKLCFMNQKQQDALVKW